MSRKDRFYIDVYHLKNGIHQYDFEIDDQFFQDFGTEFTEHGKGTAMVTLDKTDSLISATFDLDLKVELTCDRSLEKFEFPVIQKEKLLFKYGEEEQELDVDVLMITKDTQRINFGKHLHDYIGLAIPYKKVHPNYTNIEEEEDEIFFQTHPDASDEEQAEDPRWEALKKLKNKDN